MKAYRRHSNLLELLACDHDGTLACARRANLPSVDKGRPGYAAGAKLLPSRTLPERQLWAIHAPPFHGSSPAPKVYGGAQLASLLASGLFTGESTQKPPAPARPRFRLIFRGLRNQRSGTGGFLTGSRESIQRNPRTSEATPGSHLRLGWPEGIDSTSKNGLTKLPPLTYPLIIEELRPEETLAGVSFS